MVISEKKKEIFRISSFEKIPCSTSNFICNTDGNHTECIQNVEHRKYEEWDEIFQYFENVTIFINNIVTEMDEPKRYIIYNNDIREKEVHRLIV